MEGYLREAHCNITIFVIMGFKLFLKLLISVAVKINFNFFKELTALKQLKSILKLDTSNKASRLVTFYEISDRIFQHCRLYNLLQL